MIFVKELMMATAPEAGVTFKTASYMRMQLHVDDSVLLRIVAQGKVRVMKTSTHPRYCVEDVEQFLCEQNIHAKTAGFIKAS
jgi:hypothetical protein